MKSLKSFFAVVLCCALALIPCLSVAALDKNKNFKGSLSEYSGKGTLKSSVTQLCSFDSGTGITSTGHSIDTAEKKEGTGCYSYTFSTSLNSVVKFFNAPSLFSPVDASATAKTTFRMWVYVSDMNLLRNDHVDVHPDYQDEYDDYTTSGTIFVRLIDSSTRVMEINHTIYGSGWQECEFAVDPDTDNFNYSSITGIWVGAVGNKGLTIKFDDLRVVRFTNDGYSAPEAPLNGTWLSTCDFDALDGARINEWYGGFFDDQDKVSGSSSIGLNVRRIDDFRLFWPSLNIPVNLTDQVLFFWFKSDNITDLNTIEFYLHEQDNYGGNHISISKLGILSNVYDPSTLKKTTFNIKGWNMIMLPLKSYATTVGQEVFTIGVMRIAVFGINNKVDFNVKFDDIYIASEEAVNAARASEVSTSGQSSLSEEIISSAPYKAKGIDGAKLAGLIAAAVVAAAAVIIILLVVRGKKKSGIGSDSGSPEAGGTEQNDPSDGKSDSNNNSDGSAE